MRMIWPVFLPLFSRMQRLKKLKPSSDELVRLMPAAAMLNISLSN